VVAGQDPVGANNQSFPLPAHPVTRSDDLPDLRTFEYLTQPK
jgi:hypothetical protein